MGNLLDNDYVYITCGDIYYMDLIEKLVKSLLNVSNQKIIVYGINCKVPFDYPNLIKKELNIPIKRKYDKWFWKQISCIESLNENISNYVWMDGDIIANYNIDNISNYFHLIDNYPIADIHVQDEQLFINNNNVEYMGEKISKYYNTERKILPKDIHACFYIYNKKCEWFFKEIIDIYHYIYDNKLYEKLLTWNDESLHNFMMSKYNFKKTLPLSNLALICNHNKYDTNKEILEKFYSYWNDKSPNNFNNVFGWSYIPENKEQILYFHENKNLKDADEMIEFIKMKKNNSFNNSKWFFINKNKIHNFENDRSLKELNLLYDSCKDYESINFIEIEKDDIVLDIGSNIGFFERYSYLKNSSKIISFEKNKDIFDILKLNTNYNTDLFNANISNINKDDKLTNSYSIDYLFESDLLNKIDFLKIDDENNEINILNGINDINLLKIMKISIKWYDFNKLDKNIKDEIMDRFIKNSYDIFITNNINYSMVYLKNKIK